MYIKGQEDWIFGSYDRTRQNKDREGKSSRSSRLAGTKECEGCVEVFRVGKLLQTICQNFCKDSKISS